MLRRRLQQSTPYEDVLQSSEVERLRRELRELRATCAAGRRRLNATEEKLLESSLDSVEGALTLTLTITLTLTLTLTLTRTRTRSRWST